VRSAPRILPLVGIAAGGVLALNALGGARDLPSLVTGARAFAEEAVKTAAPGKGGAEKAKSEAGAAAAAVPAALPPPSIKPQPVCAPTAAELAKEAGLSPAELQVLQNLGARRGELDKQQSDLDTQMAVINAAELKLDAKAKALEGLKADIQKLLDQANGRQDAEVDRLVKVFEAMKPRDAAPRMVLLDDAVRLPIAAKMKERALSAIIAQMPPADAKKLTEALAKRFSAAQTLAANAGAQADQAAAAPMPEASAKAPAKPVRQARAAPRKHAPASKKAKAQAPPAVADPAAGAAPKAG
jgi:flagellar motility protein MotE (MotC chaperone)